MRDLSSPSWVIPRFLGKRVIKGNLVFPMDFWQPLKVRFVGFNSDDLDSMLREHLVVIFNDEDNQD
jgi:hypothetical protein